MGRKGIIFDFDNTIANTNSTKANRQNRRWKEAIRGTANYKADPHIVSLFGTLKKEDIKTCVVTNAPENYCRTAMNHLGLSVDYIVGYHDTPFVHKPESEPVELALCLMGHPDEVVGIGDEDVDVVAYNRAGIRAINYQEHSGYYAKGNVITNCATADELEAVIYNYFGIKNETNSKTTVEGSKNVMLEEAQRLEIIEKKIMKQIDSLEARAKAYEDEMHSIMAIDYDVVDEKKQLADKRTKYYKMASEYELCKGTPYFGRMVVDERNITSGNIYRNASYLIGKRGISTDEDGILVHDWRTGIGDYFYMKSELEFQINNYNYTLNMRRALNIKNASLIDYNTEYDRAAVLVSEPDAEIITDPFLQQVLMDKRRENRATDIISTIQTKQNEIIRSDVNKSFIVQGCAGSGKTMILLHRLSYLLFNEKITTDRTVIITPNKNLVAAISDLSVELGIDKIKKLSIIEYYVKLLQQYTSDVTGKVDVYESRLNSNLLAEIYSDDYFDFVNSRFDDYWNGCTKILEENDWRNLFDKFSTNDYQLKVDDSHLRKSKIYSSKDIDVNTKSKHSFSMMDNTISQILNNTSRMRKEYKEYSQRVREIDVQLEEVKWKLKHKDNILRGPLYERVKTLSERKKQLLARLNELNVLLPSEAENNALINCSKAIGMLTFDNILGTLMKELLIPVYEGHNEELTQKIYQHKLYVQLILCYRYFGELSNLDFFINIDEAQDLSICEYRLLKNILGPKAVFNLYGDIGQLIYDFKDINDWKQLDNTIADKRYDLSENYRNTLQITEYCNRFFNINLYPIGIAGADVIELNISDSLEAVRHLRHENPEYRIAVISKSTSEALKQTIDKCFSLEEYSWKKIDDDKVSVISVEMAKGLEFNAVVVIAEGMTEKELYIAFTRAMDNLIINSQE